MREIITGIYPIPRNNSMVRRPRADFFLPLGMKVFCAADPSGLSLAAAGVYKMTSGAGTGYYVAPPGVRRILAMVIGASGSVLGEATAGVGGTGGGGFAADLISVYAGQAFAVAPGQRGTFTPGGVTGGTTSFGGVLSATGSGQATTTAGTAGGSGSGGRFNKSGGTGGTANTIPANVGGGGGASGSPLGAGGAGGSPTSNRTGGGGGLGSSASDHLCGTANWHLLGAGFGVVSGENSEWYKLFGPYANLGWVRMESGEGGISSGAVAGGFGGDGAGFMGFGGGVGGGLGNLCGKHGAVIVVEFDQ